MFLDKLKFASHHSRWKICICSFLSSTWPQNIILLPCFTVTKAVKYAVVCAHQNTSDTTRSRGIKITFQLYQINDIITVNFFNSCLRFVLTCLSFSFYLVNFVVKLSRKWGLLTLYQVTLRNDCWTEPKLSLLKFVCTNTNPFRFLTRLGRLLTSN